MKCARRKPVDGAVVEASGRFAQTGRTVRRAGFYREYLGGSSALRGL